MFSKIILFIPICILFFYASCSAASAKLPEFSGEFYPSSKEKLSKMIDGFLNKANPPDKSAHPLILISPHAGYGFSGQASAFGYKLLENKNYKTVIIIGNSHHKLFSGAGSLWGRRFCYQLRPGKYRRRISFKYYG